MPFLNSVHLIGHLSDEPKGRDAGKSYVSNFRISINDGSKDKPEWNNINAVMWGEKARSLVSIGSKGDVVEVSGKIITRSYDDKSGKKVYITEVKCGTLSLIKSKKKEDTFEEE